jgi:hypothetical protein
MSYTRVICMECAADYMQKTDPTGQRYQINVYMCGVCGCREIYKKELTDEEADELTKVSLRESEELPVR